jgi:hypothetical protein
MTLKNHTVRSDWQKAIEATLKGRQVDDLVVSANGINMPAFAHDRPEELPHLVTCSQPWQIADFFEAGQDLKALNSEIIAGLTGGLEAIGLDCSRRVMLLSDWEQTWQDVWLDMISCHVVIDSDTDQLDTLTHATKGAISGSIRFKGLDDEWQLVCQKHCFDTLPGMRCLVLEIDLAGDVVASIKHFLSDMAAHWSFWSKQHDVDLSYIASQFVVHVSLSQRYLLNIACLRALRVLWMQNLDILGVPFVPLMITTIPATSTLTTDVHHNMIAAALQTQAAVLGGCDVHFNRISLVPTTFDRRIARNQQHMLRLESGLGFVQDPLAGSYYMEQLTSQIVHLSRQT